jgi:hypothetical protein
VIKATDYNTQRFCPVLLRQNPDAKLINKQTIQNINQIPPKLLEQLQKPKSASIECSQEQIDSRLAICQQCEFYQDNSCLQCGCVLSRDRTYMNKLYKADQSCPIGKWGPIPSDVSQTS